MRGEIMAREICEQPEAIGRLLAQESERLWDMPARWLTQPLAGIYLAARGTSDHAALYAKYAIETVAGIPVGLAAPSITSVYHATLTYTNCLVIGISQSGEAADVAATLEAARAGGAHTLAITNVANSPLTRFAEETLLLHAGTERAVAATKTYTNTLAALLLLAAALGRREDLFRAVREVPELIQTALDTTDGVNDVAAQLRYLRECVVLGRGFNMATAYELALKLRETCYLRAQPFAAPDFVHGPIAMLDDGFPVIAIANVGPVLPSVMEVLTAVRARGADTIVIGNAGDALAQADLELPTHIANPELEILSPFASITVGQLLAQRLSVLRGLDPDHPRGLRKVTITR